MQAHAEGQDQSLDTVTVTTEASSFRQMLGVEVTGTAIINPKARERLPLTIIERRDIERSGAVNLFQLLDGLSIVSNSSDEGQMITAAGGAVSVGLRGEPNSTLLLLNGVRLPNYAQFSLSGEASSAHLRLIPLSIVDRIEILREGASTLYGSDAVAGVVNVITRTDLQGFHINTRQGLVAHGKGNQHNLELSWGKGNFNKDGYQLLASVGRHITRPVLGADRPSAWEPNSVITNDATAIYTWPGSIFDPSSNQFLPHPYYSNGTCDGQHLYAGEEVGLVPGRCYFDRTSLRNIYPSDASTSAFVQARVSLGRERSAFFEHATNRSLSSYNTPTNSHIKHQDSSTGYVHHLSLLAAGARFLQNQDDFQRTVGGLQGHALGHSYKAYVFDGQQTTSRSTSRDIPFGEYTDLFTTEELNTPPSQLGQATLDKIRSLHQRLEGATSHSQTYGLQAQISGQIEQEDGLESQYAVAAGWRAEHLRFQSVDSRRNSFHNSRRVAHVLGEWAVPLNESFTVALGARTDNYSDAGQANTGKVSARYKHNDLWMWRGAIGNGFRAPGLMLTSTANGLVAMFPASAHSQNRPVLIFNQGNSDLQPEKSRHITLGGQYTSNRWAATLDWWALNSSNLVYVHDWNSVLHDPVLQARYVQELPVGYPNPNNALGMYLQPQNLARRDQQGLDYQVQYRQPLDRGTLRWQWAGTLNIRSRFKVDNNTVSDLGHYAGETARYTPRHKWALSTTYDPKSSQRHRLTLNYLSGNTEVTPQGTINQVPSHWTLDWHTHVSPKPGLILGVGMTNITNHIPSNRTINSRQSATGIDTRYGDFRGRTLTLSLDAKF